MIFKNILISVKENEHVSKKYTEEALQAQDGLVLPIHSEIGDIVGYCGLNYDHITKDLKICGSINQKF